MVLDHVDGGFAPGTLRGQLVCSKQATSCISAPWFSEAKGGGRAHRIQICFGHRIRTIFTCSQRYF